MSGRHGRHRADGFTLIEVTVVIIVLGLLTTAAVVSWQAMIPNQALNSGVRHLSETIFGTRSDAIARNREFQIHYDLDNDSYGVRTPFLAAGGGLALTEDDPRIWIRERNLSEDGVDIVEVTIDDKTYTDGVVYVRFDPLGASAYHTVVLEQSVFERQFTIESLPLTGEIRFHDGLFRRELARESDFK